MGLVLRFEPLAPVGVTVRPSRDLGKENRRFSRLSLGEDDPVLSGWVGPVLEQLARDWGDACVLAVATPLVHVAADVVDQAVLLAPLASRVEVERFLL